MEIEVVGVVGCGLMGTGIAQCVAQAGYRVLMFDTRAGQAEQSKAEIGNRLKRAVEKGKMTEDEREKVVDLIVPVNRLDDMHSANLVVEAVPERADVKEQVFELLDSTVSPACILATNTSGLSVTRIASSTTRPEKVVGIHFFYPAPVMKLVEVIRGLGTSEETYSKTKVFVERLGKTAVDAPDYPGFIVNRLLIPMINEAAYCVMEGAKPQDIDNAMKLGCNHPMGPLELADFVGIDIVLATMTGLLEGFGDDKYRPCPLLKKLVEAGYLGRKEKRGFYAYGD